MVKYLAWYINNYKLCKGGSYRVKLEDEIKKYKNKNPGKTPIVVFDLLACLSFFIPNDMEVLCGGRQAECTRRARMLCEKLKKLGCELIFYMDGPLRDDKVNYWLEKVNAKYERHKEVFKMINENKPLKDIHSNHIMTSYNNNFIRIAREYGKLVISVSNECDIELAEYATQHHAVGVFSCDTDFLIMKGDWPIWSSKDLNLNEFSTLAWNKKSLRLSLNLTQSQMPIFATLAGNDRLDYAIVEPFLNDIRKGAIGFSWLANYVRAEFAKGSPNREEFNKITKKLYEYHKDNNIENRTQLVENEEDLRKRISSSLNFYNYKRISKYEVRPPWLKTHIDHTASTVAFMITKELPIIIRQNYIDLSKSDVKAFSELVLPVLRRMMGIVLYSKPVKEITRRVFLKPSHDEPFQMKHISPLYPTSDIPFFKKLLGYSENDVSEQVKFEILSWIVSSGRRKLQPSGLMEIRESIYFIPVIILNYLVKDMQITCEEADVILLVIQEGYAASDEKLTNLVPPEKLEARPFWIAFVYVQITFYFMNAVILCGLYKYVQKDYFDGYIFHKMYPKYLTMDIDKRKTLLEPVERYRLYAK